MRQELSGLWTILKATVALWSSRNAFQLAGALAFYTLFSMAPLLIILITMTGVIFGAEAARGEISTQIERFIGPAAAEEVEEAVRRSRLEEAGLLPTTLGIAAVLFGATTVFAQMQAALNRIWGVVSRPSRSSLVAFVVNRLLSLGLVLIIGFLLLVSFVATTAIAALVRYADDLVPLPGPLVAGIDLALSLVVATVLFAMIFKVLPDVRLAWRDVWRGALLTAAFFILGQYVISLYLTRVAPASTYGAAASLVLVLLWVYYSSLLIFFGAALTAVLVRHGGGHVVPKASAVTVETEFVEHLEDGTTRRHTMP